MFQGSMVALVSPMGPEGLDYPALKRLVQFHLDQGSHALVVNGTTGEAATLSVAEQSKNLDVVLDTVRGRIPVIAGTGTASTAETLSRSRQAMRLGADACLIVTPYYNRPSQAGLYAHYANIAEMVAMPIILYNVSTRTAVDLLPETVARLAEIPNIVGLKEASSDPYRWASLRALCGQKLDLFSGDDPTALAFMQQGGQGVISVTANVAPKLMAEMCLAHAQGQAEQAADIQAKLAPLHALLFTESNPIPVKWALMRMGLIENVLRLPLQALAPEYHPGLEMALKQAGMLKPATETITQGLPC